MIIPIMIIVIVKMIKNEEKTVLAVGFFGN
jgi:hypothetical protein